MNLHRDQDIKSAAFLMAAVVVAAVAVKAIRWAVEGWLSWIVQ